jgi:hypothetical protein
VQKLNVEDIRNGKVQIQIIGKRVTNPEAIYEDLRKRILPLEKQKDELTPQWLRGWQDSRSDGHSSPP